MKRSLIFFAAVAICAASCGTVGEFSDSDRFQDGIYYKPNPRMVGREPLAKEDFKYLASMDNFRREVDTTSVLRDTVYIAVEDWNPYGYWRPYHWGYYSHWGYYPYYSGYYSPYWGYDPYWYSPYWGSPYYYGWGYDPYWWDYGWYGYGHGYYGYPYHRPYYGYHHSGTYMPRTGSATSGHYSRPVSGGGFSTPGRVSSAANRSASAMAQRDLDRIKVQRTGHRTTAVNRETGYSETTNYRTISATRASSGASYNRSSDQRSSTRYESSSSSRSYGSSRSSSYSGGGSSSSHSSHSSGGGGYHGGGHGGHR